MKKLLISFLFLSSTLVLAQRVVDKRGFFLFPKCEKAEEELNFTCNKQELHNFITSRIEYPSYILEKKHEGIIEINYLLTRKGKFHFFIEKDNKNFKPFEEIAVKIMSELKDSINKGKIKAQPAIKDNKYVDSYYLLPIEFKHPNTINNTDTLEPKKMVLATYKTIEKTIEFRSDKNNNLYFYLLTPEGDKLLMKLNGNADMKVLTEEEQFYFFLYNLTLSKSEVLLVSGKIENENYEIYIDKSANPTINIYTDNSLLPLETIKTIEELLASRYSVLMFK